MEEDMIDPAMMLHLQPCNNTPPCKTIRVHNNDIRGDVLRIAEVEAFCRDGQNKASTENGAIVSYIGKGCCRQHLHIALNPPCIIDNVSVYKCLSGARLEMVDTGGRVFFDKALRRQSAEQNVYLY
ncbi:unnamed protein product [Ectocarpus sp. 6 AP-2014]